MLVDYFYTGVELLEALRASTTGVELLEALRARGLLLHRG